MIRKKIKSRFQSSNSKGHTSAGLNWEKFSSVFSTSEYVGLVCVFCCLCLVWAGFVFVRPRCGASVVGVNDVARPCSRAGRRANELPRGRKGGACGLRAKAAWPRWRWLSGSLPIRAKPTVHSQWRRRATAGSHAALMGCTLRCFMERSARCTNFKCFWSHAQRFHVICNSLCL